VVLNYICGIELYFAKEVWHLLLFFDDDAVFEVKPPLIVGSFINYIQMSTVTL